MQVLPLADADVRLDAAFFPAEEADSLLVGLLDGITWQQESIRLYGKEIALPRLTAWYGDPGTTYRYSGITVTPHPWTALLLRIKEPIEAAAGCAFNSVLLNRYRDGRDSVSWHADDEPELGADPIIASVSFGGARAFQFKHKADPERRHAVTLTHGSLLVMGRGSQLHWLHQVPKTRQDVAERINLTFRWIRVS